MAPRSEVAVQQDEIFSPSWRANPPTQVETRAESSLADRGLANARSGCVRASNRGVRCPAPGAVPGSGPAMLTCRLILRVSNDDRPRWSDGK